MKKDIEWLKKWVEEYENKIIKELRNKLADGFMAARLHGGRSAVKEIKHRINQLDEPEVKQLYEKIRELETFNDELIRDNNQFRNELDNQEVLSSEWIEQKSIDTHVDTLSGDVQVTFRMDDLESIIVPKQEESEETEAKSKQELIEKWESAIEAAGFYGKGKEERLISYMKDFVSDLNQLDEPEQPKITLQDLTEKLWELPLNNRKLWLARLNDEFQGGYIVPLGLKTTDGEEQYLTYNGSYFASQRNRCLQQTFATLEEIPEFYRDLAERVL